jgi:hypothetical protein|uniref:helix-turn-helix domain-containing protein n=1 Tax=Waltera acetigignens TaxID=2981769 RepID=UPI003F7ECFE5
MDNKRFHEQLNEYLEELDCTAKELGEVSGVSAATLSRYRSGSRIPDAGTEAFNSICEAIGRIAGQRGIETLTEETVRESFLRCLDMTAVDKEQLRTNFNLLATALNMNMARLCQQINYDSSTVFRFRNGSRQPAEPEKFAEAVAKYVAENYTEAAEREKLARILQCDACEFVEQEHSADRIKRWLLEPGREKESGVTHFLEQLDQFDLNEYIKAIHFDEWKVPPAIPFRLSTSKSYTGLKNMMEAELDFLKDTVLSKSMDPVIMYSDMPMEEMAKDPEFPKKWMFGMAIMLKKGLHLHQIHNLDRSFEEMMLGLESWIPMYMTGQISPYYLKAGQDQVFLHFLKVSGSVALTGEAIRGYHSEGKYYLARSKDEVAYYRKRAGELLNCASPLMEIYREENAGVFEVFLRSDAETAGERRNILSAPPIWILDREWLEAFLLRRKVSGEQVKKILNYADTLRQLNEHILQRNRITDEITLPEQEEFAQYPVNLSLSGMFCETDISYTWEEYQEHLEQMRMYEQAHENYILKETKAQTFRNLQIQIHEGKWAMVSKGKAPAIHFVIYHSRLREAIEQFVPPVVED